MALETRNNVCIGCGEAEGDPHKPGCERYTSSPIVRAVDTPHGQNQVAIAQPGGGTRYEPGPDSPRGFPGPLIRAEEPWVREVTLITRAQVQELLARVRERHGPGYTHDDLVHDLHREGDNAIPIAAEPRRSALDVVGWVEKIWLSIGGDIRGVIRTIDDSAWDVIQAGAGLAGNIAFDWAIKSDGSFQRAAFLTEVVIQPPVPDAAVDEEGYKVGEWSAHVVPLAPADASSDHTQRERQAQNLALLLNTLESFKLEHVVALTDGTLLLIGRRF